MVKFIINGAEYDISAAVRQEISALLQDSAEPRKIFLIVPEQFEFETEKAVYGDLSERGLLLRRNEINVVTFSSLSGAILAESGETRVPAGDAVKNIIMHKAVREQKTALSSLARQASRAGFCKKMVQTVSMLKTAGLTANDLSENAGILAKSETLKNCRPVMEKLRDVGKIFGSYENYLSGYIDRLDVTRKAADIIANGGDFFEGADVFADCFNDFTGSQLYFLTKLVTRARNVVLGFAAEPSENRPNVFSNMRLQINRIMDEARENDAKTVIKSSGLPRRISKDSPLCELSRKIFGTEKAAVSLGESCEIIRAADVYEEADFAAAKIKELCCEKGFLYRETAVLCADPSYGKYIRAAFEKYEIPVFLDIPEPILRQPAVNLFTALLNVLADLSVDNVLSYIKTGFISKPASAEESEKNPRARRKALSKKDIDVFESYIFEWNLGAKHLKKPFDFSDRDTDGARLAEEIRKSVVEPLLSLRKKLKNADGAAITRLIYDFAVNEIDIERALYNRCLKQNSGETDTELLRVNQQLWNSLAEILETLERELAGENISLEEYGRLFSDICAGTALAKPPQFMDCVLVGDVDRTRAVGIRAAFIVGASYESFPTPASGAGIFSENETELIRENLAELGAASSAAISLRSAREQYCLSLYRAYRAVSLPTEYLAISFPDCDAKGASVSRSQVIGEILGIFPQTEIIRASSPGDGFYCRSIKAAKQRYAESLQKNTRQNAVLKTALRELGQSDFTDKLDEILNARAKNAAETRSGTHHLTSQTARALFDRRLGATSAEKLNLCRFGYFCAFGLKIRERNQRVFNVGNRGSAVHYVLQKILEKYCDKMEEFFRLTRAELTALARFYLDEFTRNETNGDFEEDKRTQFLFANLANAAADVLITLQAEFAARDYRPKFFELNISDGGEKAVIDNQGDFSGELPAAELYSENVPAGETVGSGAPSADGSGDYLLTAPLKITLSDGSEILIAGRIDRVDMFFTSAENGKKRSYLRVVDYKFNAKSFDAENARRGVNIQMLLYLFALCDANLGNKTELLPGAISYLPSAVSGAVEDRMSAFRLLAMNHHQNGLYIRDEMTDAEAKKYADFVIEKIAAEAGAEPSQLDEKTKAAIIKAFVPEGGNAPDAEQFAELRRDCLALIKSNLEMIFGGDVSASPLKYSETNIGIDGKLSKKHKTSCDYCRFSQICGSANDNFTDLEAEKGAMENE